MVPLNLVIGGPVPLALPPRLVKFKWPSTLHLCTLDLVVTFTEYKVTDVTAECVRLTVLHNIVSIAAFFVFCELVSSDSSENLWSYRDMVVD